jgi:hypothetical protein
MISIYPAIFLNYSERRIMTILNCESDIYVQRKRVRKPLFSLLVNKDEVTSNRLFQYCLIDPLFQEVCKEFFVTE